MSGQVFRTGFERNCDWAMELGKGHQGEKVRHQDSKDDVHTKAEGWTGTGGREAKNFEGENRGR